MAIKFNWKDLQKRIFNGVEAQKVMLNWIQIWPEVAPTPIYDPWVYHNPIRWIISVSANGSDWYTIRDKNYGATQVFNYWDTRDTDKVWLFFQWGNNYWFRMPNQWTGSQYTNISNYYATSETQVDSSLYPDWYNNSTFIVGHQYWTLLNGYNYAAWHLWSSSTSFTPWFHMPSMADWNHILDTFEARWLCWWYNRCVYSWEPVFRYLKIPLSNIIQDDWFFAYGWNYTLYWSGDSSNRWPNPVRMRTGSYGVLPWDGDARWLLIREFADTPVVPDTTRTVLYQPN